MIAAMVAMCAMGGAGALTLALWGIAAETAARGRWETAGAPCCRWHGNDDVADALHAEVTGRYERLVG